VFGLGGLGITMLDFLSNKPILFYFLLFVLNSFNRSVGLGEERKLAK